MITAYSNVVIPSSDAGDIVQAYRQLRRQGGIRLGRRAMSDEDVIRSLYDAFDRGDLESVESLVSGAMEVQAGPGRPPGLPWSGAYYGPVGFRNFLEIIREYVDLRVETDSIRKVGPVIIQVGRAVGRAHASGVNFSF